MSSTASIAASPLSVTRVVPPSRSSDTSRTGVAALTQRLAAGDEAAFREFHALYFDRLYVFLLVVTRGQEHAAQDAVQETLVRVARHARAFENEDVFWSWLKAIARNAARDGGRKERRYLALLQAFAFRRGDVALSRDDDENWRSVLEESLGEMERLDRELLEGKYLRGLTVMELSTLAGLSEKTVESRLLRLRRQLGDRVLRKLRAQ